MFNVTLLQKIINIIDFCIYSLLILCLIFMTITEIVNGRYSKLVSAVCAPKTSEL